MKTLSMSLGVCMSELCESVGLFKVGGVFVVCVFQCLPPLLSL